MKFELKKEAGKEMVAVKFVEGSVSKFVETDGGTELRLGFTPHPGPLPVKGEGATPARPLSRRRAVLFLRKIVATAKTYKLKSLALSWEEVRGLVAPAISDAALGELFAVAFVMADFEFVTYKKKPADGFAFLETVFVKGATAEAVAGIRRGEVVGAEVNGCRTLANTPGGDMTPKRFASAAKVAVKGLPVTVKVLGETEMEKLGMGGVLGVGMGSMEESQFIIMEYPGVVSAKSGSKKTSIEKQKPLVFIGKGVTFDSGGLSLKPVDGMTEMHLDMSGGAAVIHAVALAAKLKLATPIIGLIPAVENMPSGAAIRPCDLLKTMSGRTIEVLNTDAEGRVILADAITYAKRYDPRLVVECSTLTGASIIALGFQATAMMSTDQCEECTLRTMRLGEESGDYVWPFPLWEEYEELVKSDFGDVANVPNSGYSRRAGVIGGGMFLREFAKDLSCEFIHLDIAPRMTAAPGEHLAKGAAGAPVRLLLAMAENVKSCEFEKSASH